MQHGKTYSLSSEISLNCRGRGTKEKDRSKRCYAKSHSVPMRQWSRLYAAGEGETPEHHQGDYLQEQIGAQASLFEVSLTESLNGILF